MKKRPYIGEIVFLFLFSFIPLLWFTPQHMVLGADSGYPVDFIGYFNQRTFTWLGSQNFGRDMSAQMGQLSLHALQAIVSWLHVSMYSVEQVTFVFWFLSMALSMYFFIRYLYPKPQYIFLRIITVLVYVINFYLFSFWIQGEQPTFSLFVLLPLVVLLLLKFLRKQMSALNSAIFISLVFFMFNVGGIYGFPLTGSVIVSGSILIIFHLVLTSRKNIIFEICQIGKFGALLSGIGLFLNAYWLFPFLSSIHSQYATTFAKAGGFAGTVGWTRFISEKASFLNLTRLQGDINWYNHPGFYSNAFLQNPMLIFFSFLFPVLAFSAIFYITEKEEKKIVIYFMLLFLIGVFFAAGIHKPFGDAYLFLMEKVPGFVAFRSAYYKFVPIIYFACSPLVGISIYYLSRKISVRYGSGICLLFIALFFLYHYPFFQKDNLIINKPFSTMVHVPSYVMDFAQYEKQSKDDGRILIVPEFSEGFPVETYNWNYLSFSPLFLGITDKNVLSNAGDLTDDEKIITTSLYKTLWRKDFQAFINLAEMTNVKYILVTNDATYNYHSSPRENPAVYNNILSKKKELFEQIWHVGPWFLYKVNKISEQGKIRSYGNPVQYNGNIEDIDGLLQMSKSAFIAQSQILPNTPPMQVVASLPFSATITDHSCISCTSAINQEVDKIFSSNILPDSFLYPLKDYKQKRRLAKVTDDSQRLDILLDLTKQKISEVRAFKEKDPKITLKSDWLISTDALYDYLEQIYSISSNPLYYQNNYEKLQKIDQFVKSEHLSLIEILDDITFGASEPLAMSLANSMWELSRIQNFVDKILEKNRYYDHFVFSTPDSSVGENTYYLYDNSLPRDISDSPIRPEDYSLDGSSFLHLNYTEEIFTISTEKLYSRLSLRIQNLPNILYQTREVLLNFPTKKQRCFMGEIPNYSWRKKYIASATIQNSPDEVFIYIKRNYDQFLTADNSVPKNNYFYFDGQYSLNKKSETNYFSYIFSGSPNDKGMSVYFCTDVQHDPYSVFMNPSIYEVASPKVYSTKLNKFPKLSSPRITYIKNAPTDYTVNVVGAKTPFVLTFFDRFSPLWKLSIEGENDNLLQKQFILNGYANGWQIDKLGSYKIHLSFYPQRIFIFGLIVSLTSLTIIVIYGLIKLIRSIRYEKSKK